MKVRAAGNIVAAPADQYGVNRPIIWSPGMGFDPPRTSVVLFDYNKTPGIDVNKSLLGLTKGSSTGRAHEGYFAGDVVVIDNYVYNNGHKGV